MLSSLSVTSLWIPWGSGRLARHCAISRRSRTARPPARWGSPRRGGASLATGLGTTVMKMAWPASRGRSGDGRCFARLYWSRSWRRCRATFCFQDGDKDLRRALRAARRAVLHAVLGWVFRPLHNVPGTALRGPTAEKVKNRLLPDMESEGDFTVQRFIHLEC